MPVVRLSRSRLLKLVGIDDWDKVREALANLKCGVEAVVDDEVEIEVTSDRPDLFSTEGIAKAVRMFLGLEKPRKIEISGIEFVVEVDPPRKRPFIAVAAIDRVDLDERGLEELIQFQEKLHVTYGRGRRKVAIGLHDLDKLPSKHIRYTYVRIDEAKMIPLHLDKEMTVKQVLEEVEQGKLYGSISLDGDLHPAVLSGDKIIAIPPVINSDITRLESSTRRIFIDVTGTDLQTVIKILNVIVNALSIYGGRVLGAEILYPDRRIVTPDLTWRSIELDLDYAEQILGLELGSADRATQLLERMGYLASSVDEHKLVVEVPPYRVDVLHPIDVVEDLAIAIGYSAIEPDYVASYGRTLPDMSRAIERIVRDILVGLGYAEVNTFSLISRRLLEALGYREFVEIENPISTEMDCIRPSPLPSLIAVLKNSQHCEMPIKIFEIGSGVVRDEASATGWRNLKYVAIAVMSSLIKFEDIHGDVYALLRELGVEPKTKRCSKPMSIEGRTACIYVNGVEVGWIGELHPEILERIEIRYPVAVAELYLDRLIDIVAEQVRRGVV